MNDITALMATMKAAAEKAGIEQWVSNRGEVNSADYEVDGGTYIDHVCNCEIVGTESPKAEFIAVANPANVKALVEALEARDKHIAELADDIEQQRKSWADIAIETGRLAVAMGKLADDKDKRIAELEQSLSAAENNEIDARCHVTELESRTVTPVTYSESADADSCRKWAWEQVKGEVSTEGWTTGDNINYFGFFCWGWDMRRQYNEQRTVTVKLPAMNDDLIAILGRPNFMCAHLAELLRKSGEDIKRKSEHEQAAVIHWFLGLYLEHGEKWESVAKSDIQRRAAGIQVIEGDAPQGA